MPYTLGKLSLGTSRLDKLFDIDTEFEISGMCHIDGFGFLLIFHNHHFIGYADYKGKTEFPWMGIVNEKRSEEQISPMFNCPSSVCYHPISKRCFLIECGGTGIYSLDVEFKNCRRILVSEDYTKYLSKIKCIDHVKTSCDIDRAGVLYWCVEDVHRCFKMDNEDNSIQSFFGNGVSGFSNSNDLKRCSLSHPLDVRCIGHSLYVADSGNHCIRRVESEVAQVIMGNPLSTEVLSSPSQIRYNSNIVYVLDQQVIKYVSLNDKNNGIIYTSQNIVAIESGPKKELYVLERL